MSRIVRPWEGTEYESRYRGVKLFILGEAHYGSGEPTESETEDIINRLAIKSQFRFFNRVIRLVTGTPGWISPEKKSEFWHSVAFANLIQSFPGDRARIRPVDDMWSQGFAALEQSLNELKPDLILTLGLELERRLPLHLKERWRFCHVQHPSSYGFRYEDWTPIVTAGLQAAATARVAEKMPATQEEPWLGFGIRIDFDATLDDDQLHRHVCQFLQEVVESQNLGYHGVGRNVDGFINAVAEVAVKPAQRLRVIDWAARHPAVESFTVTQLRLEAD